MSILDIPVYQDFVSPSICKELHLQGLQQCYYKYRLYAGNIAELYTYAFDKDDYYLQADANIDHCNHVAAVRIDTIPAWSLKEMEKLIPGNWLVQKTESGYEIMCESLYNIASQVSERLPDAFAKVVLFGLKSRMLKVSHCNKVITLMESHRP